MLRAFIAVRVGASLSSRRVLSQLQKVGHTVRPVSEEALHITLYFLGDVDSRQVPTIVDAIGMAVSCEQVFQLRMAGVGIFSNRVRPTVVWAAVEDNGVLGRIVRRLVAPLERLGFTRESRPWHAHLTLARIKARPPATLDALLDAHASTEFGIEQVRYVELIRSELTPTGPYYSVLGSVPLAER